MRNKIILGGAIVLLLVTVGWSIGKSYKQKIGSNGNNGYTQEFQMPSGNMRKTMESAMRRPRPEGDPTDPAQAEQMRQEFEKELTPEQKEEFKKMMTEMVKRMERTRAALGPEDTRLLMTKFRERFMNGGGPGGPRPPSPPAK